MFRSKNNQIDGTNLGPRPLGPGWHHGIGLALLVTVLGGLGWPLAQARAVVHPVGAPSQLLIPKIGVKAQIRRTGVLKTGVLQPPPTPKVVGWYKGSAVPGFRGNAVMAGHLDWYTGPGVFWRLSRVRVGDSITVVNDFGKKIVYKVRDIKTYRYKQVPLQKIVGPSRGYHLNLYTCSGFYSSWSANYSHRIVVYTDQVQPAPKK